jgi:peptide/nickel transport system permease protein
MIDPQHEIEGALSAEVPTPAPGLSDVAAKLLAQDTEVGVVQLGQGQLIWRRFRKHKLAMIGAVTLVLLVLMAIFAPLVSPETYANYNYDISVHNLAPSLAWPWSSGWKYVLGTDANGHSLVMWIAYGARVSLMVGILSSILTMILAIVLGGVAGYFGGWVDALVMRITDVFLTLPTLPLLILLADYLASGSATVIIILFAVLSWPGNARLVRSYYLTFRSQEFTEAARAVGVGDARIIFRHILPNALSPIIVAATLAVAAFIGTEAAIDFLGVGIHPPSTSWGLSLANAQTYFTEGNWWWPFFPGFFLLLTTLSINFLGDGLRDALDVRSRAR